MFLRAHKAHLKCMELSTDQREGHTSTICLKLATHEQALFDNFLLERSTGNPRQNKDRKSFQMVRMFADDNMRNPHSLHCILA